MEQLKAKLKKQGGFTMVELLIVVAIIAILVAVSIPMMNSALERSRHAVDQANVRDAIGLALTEYVTEKDDALGTYSYEVNDETHIGVLVKDGDNGVKPQCKCSDAATVGLTVTLTAPTNAGDPPGVETNWNNDGQGGSTK